MQQDPLIRALREAVAAAPEQPQYRLHLAEALVRQGAMIEAITEITEVLRLDPSSADARRLMAQALQGDAKPTPTPSPESWGSPGSGKSSGTPPNTPEFDWQAAESQLDDTGAPRFAAEPATASLEAAAADVVDAYEAERPTVSLADVGGMADVKERLRIAFLAPMSNPQLRKLYGKSLRGGLLLYGPPGCGKTFIARAVAGELGAAFISVGIAEVLDMWVGGSERNLRGIFQLARRKAPCVLFFDEVDALGQRRSQLRNNSMRTTVNQFLQELDSVDSDNEGVFVLGATNSPWDVDTALRRPGRFDRTILVLPPDAPAREQVLRYHLRDRPIAGIDLAELVGRTGGFSGADLAHLCESAAERALADSVSTGEVRMIAMADFHAVLGQVRPSVGPWFDAAKSVALFANEGGVYDDLLDHMKNAGMM